MGFAHDFLFFVAVFLSVCGILEKLLQALGSGEDRRWRLHRSSRCHGRGPLLLLGTIASMA